MYMCTYICIYTEGIVKSRLLLIKTKALECVNKLKVVYVCLYVCLIQLMIFIGSCDYHVSRNGTMDWRLLSTGD